MVRTPSQVSEDIRASLRLSDPELSAHIGSPERKIIDAVASVISASYIQSQITSSIWDIDTKAGVELEEICGLFGFGRRAGTTASGTLVINLQQPAPTDYVIPAGTIASTVATNRAPAVRYSTTTPVVVAAGTSYAEVSAECTQEGAIGNTASQTIVVLETWSSVASVYNPNAFINGANAETDAELRARFKNTFLRNLAGTEDFYAALCLNHKNVTKVRVVGPVERYSEQLEALKSGAQLYLQSQIKDSKFAWPRSTMANINPGTPAERFFKENVAFQVNRNTPQIRLLCESVHKDDDPDGYFIHEGDIVNVEHEYTPLSSRNDPENNITNCVDIFVNGSEPTSISESAIVNLKQFNNPQFAGKEFYNDFGEKVNTGRMQVLGYGPVIALPPTITVDEEVYEISTNSNNKDYVLVREKSVYSGSHHAIYGIAFTGARFPSNGKLLDITYTYNRVPMVLDELMKFNKQITTDVMVHEADIVPLGVSIVVQLERGYSESNVKNEIRENLTEWANSLPYGAWIQFSDIHNVVRKSQGVDNARMKEQGDRPTGLYGIRTYSRNGRFAKDTYTKDFKLADNQLASFNSAEIIVRAENTFEER